jgi:hypothetical protein
MSTPTMRWAVCETLVSGRHTEVGDSTEKVRGGDIGPNLPRRDGRVEQRALGRLEALHEVAGQAVERRVAGVEDGGQSSLGASRREGWTVVATR